MNAFIFDMDGVLADNSDFHVQAWTEFGRAYSSTLTEDAIMQHLGYDNRGYMRFILQREPTAEEVDHAIREKEGIYRRIFAEHLAVPPGLLALLQSAHEANIVCGVATSAPEENVRFVIDGLGIRSYFKEIVDASHVKNSKPDPEIYLLAAERLGVPPARCIVFEDAIAGIHSANAAGMTTIAITSSYPPEILLPHKPAAIIASFSDLALPCPASKTIESVTGCRLTPAPTH